MNKNKSIFQFLVAISLSILIVSCSSNLQNLGKSKAEVQFYYESGQYDKDLANIISDAKDDLKNIGLADSSVVIFDVDETVLSNYPAIKDMDFGFVSDVWNKWIFSEKAPAILEVRDFYHTLLGRGFRIIFLTGRKSDQYQATYNNLIKEGYTKFDTLIVRSKDLNDAPASNFKNIERTVLSGLGYKIAACVGDQKSDMADANTGKKILLPNYLYIVK